MTTPQLTPDLGVRTLRSGFLRSAAAIPTAPALVVGDVVRSFAEMEGAARQWASGIVELAGGPARRVGVFGYRSEAGYTGVVAALFSGAAFVPLNPTFPAARTRAMIAQADLDAIVVDGKSVAQLRDITHGLAVCPAGSGARVRCTGRIADGSRTSSKRRRSTGVRWSSCLPSRPTTSRTCCSHPAAPASRKVFPSPMATSATSWISSRIVTQSPATIVSRKLSIRRSTCPSSTCLPPGTTVRVFARCSRSIFLLRLASSHGIMSLSGFRFRRSRRSCAVRTC